MLFALGFTGCMRPAAAAHLGDSPEAVTKALYRKAVAAPGFGTDTVKAERQWLTPDLYARLMKKARLPVPKGDVPDIDGDVFLNAQDLPTKWEVGKASIDGTTAKVGVDLSWSDADKRHFTVFLIQINGAWKVSDVDYNGKEGKLTDLLK